MAVGVQAVRFNHQSACADQQITKASSRGNAGMAMMRGIACGGVAGFHMLARHEHTIPGYENIIKNNHAGGLAVFGTEFRGCFTGPPRRARHNHYAGCICRHGAMQSEIGIFGGHGAAGHDQEFMDIRRASHNGLGAANDDAIRAAFLDMHMHIAIGLLARAG